MARNGGFGDDDEGSGLELSLGLPGYFSASPTQAAGGAAAFLLPHVLLCLIRKERVPWHTDRCVFCSPGGFRFRGESEQRLCFCCCASEGRQQWLQSQVTDEPSLLCCLSCFSLLCCSFSSSSASHFNPSGRRRQLLRWWDGRRCAHSVATSLRRRCPPSRPASHHHASREATTSPQATSHGWPPWRPATRACSSRSTWTASPSAGSSTSARTPATTRFPPPSTTSSAASSPVRPSVRPCGSPHHRASRYPNWRSPLCRQLKHQGQAASSSRSRGSSTAAAAAAASTRWCTRTTRATRCWSATCRGREFTRRSFLCSSSLAIANPRACSVYWPTKFFLIGSLRWTRMFIASARRLRVLRSSDLNPSSVSVKSVCAGDVVAWKMFVWSDPCFLCSCFCCSWGQRAGRELQLSDELVYHPGVWTFCGPFRKAACVKLKTFRRFWPPLPSCDQVGKQESSSRSVGSIIM